MNKYNVFRLYDNKPGCVDFLGQVDADSLDSAETVTRLMYSCDYGAGERLSVEEDADRSDIDFTCRVCGGEVNIAPPPPARAVCPEHCEDHDYVYDPWRRSKFCKHCDDEIPPDYWSYEP